MPGQLVAAERSQRVERAVNLDLTGPKPPGDRLGSLLGGRVDAAREAVLRVVGDRNRIVSVSFGWITSTGPKISSWAITISGRTSLKTVGLT